MIWIWCWQWLLTARMNCFLISLNKFNPTHVGWVGLDWIGLMWWVGLDWVEFFLTYHGGLGQKISLTRPMHTPSYGFVLIYGVTGIDLTCQMLMGLVWVHLQWSTPKTPCGILDWLCFVRGCLVWAKLLVKIQFSPPNFQILYAPPMQMLFGIILSLNSPPL